ncbi:PolC-type DNA polymerase III [Flagellimonas lutaonensis]|jgi:DNA polymerase-3 subunit epsilon|uniref:Exonuclease RNase T and DNA polymerase III n=1 Tax=Flagellimonas lutaonensis TaxID=516051 RepID=A0A0D5YUX9_9FLAO|nr:3'-5' exonuclease [Allomuricauda lutaonensis]AKA36122.1 Exonuclease RNase T and DNA polymerase III [Allomuricauda lutaonensis]
MMQLFKKKETKEHPEFWKAYTACFESDPPKTLEEAVFVVLDTETTGMNPKRHKILSIGLLKLQNMQFRVGDSLEVFIKRKNYKGQNAKVHGILKKEQEKKISEKEAIKLLLSYIKNHIIVGHHVMFDVEMINQMLQRKGLPKLKNKVLDTADLYKRTLLPSPMVYKKQHYTLDDLAQKFSIPMEDRHTALGDAYITAIAFMEIVGILKPEKLSDLFKKPKTSFF